MFQVIYLKVREAKEQLSTLPKFSPCRAWRYEVELTKKAQQLGLWWLNTEKSATTNMNSSIRLLQEQAFAKLSFLVAFLYSDIFPSIRNILDIKSPWQNHLNTHFDPVIWSMERKIVEREKNVHIYRCPLKFSRITLITSSVSVPSLTLWASFISYIISTTTSFFTIVWRDIAIGGFNLFYSDSYIVVGFLEKEKSENNGMHFLGTIFKWSSLCLSC